VSAIGLGKEELDTPALLIDLDLLEKNIRTMADYYRGRNGAALLPHQKGHRLPVIAKKQIDAGAVGVSMTSLGLAEYYVQSGIDNILITAEIYGNNKIRRLCSLSRHANVTTSIDNLENARQISDLARLSNTQVNVAVELYTGKSNSGVEVDNAKSFVQELMKLPGITFKGLWLVGPESYMKQFEDRKRSHFAWLDKLAKLKDELEDVGVNVEMLSSGQLCTWNITPEYSKLSNVGVQAGNYVFSDWCTKNFEGLEVFDCALTVLTRCISRPKPNEAMFDFGMNSCSDEDTEDYGSVVGPKFKDEKVQERIQEFGLREELAWAVLSRSAEDIRVGDIFEMIPPHSDTTAKMFDVYYGVRDNKVETVWPNYGRGLL